MSDQITNGDNFTQFLTNSLLRLETKVDRISEKMAHKEELAAIDQRVTALEKFDNQEKGEIKANLIHGKTRLAMAGIAATICGGILTTFLVQIHI